MPYATVLSVCAMILVSSLASADVFEKAEWLRDPAFKGIDTIDIYHKEKAPKPELSGPQNVHSLLRKEVLLTATPASAILHITGDDYYKFYINGDFIVQGPEPSYPFAHGYYTLDVSKHLKVGANCLAAHAYYQGLCNRVWNSADNRGGFMLVLEVTFENGDIARFTTDKTWKLHSLKAFPTGRTMGYDTQFAEDIDMRAIPKGWREAGFDDSAWETPLTGRQDHVFVEQITPPLEHWKAEPVVTKKMGEGHYFYDFGTELTGHARIRISGPVGHKIEVRHGEELSGPDAVRYEMRAGCVYQEFPVLSGREDLIEFYDYKGFRYMEILNAPSEPVLWVDVRHHPFDTDASSLEASDELLVQIWDLCKNGVRYGAQGGFLDCPTREKGQYLGDALITGHSHLIATGDPSLLKKAITDFQHSQRICPGIMAVAPGSFMQEIAEYSLQWPMVLWNYYKFTGDQAFLEAMADAAFDNLYGWFAAYENNEGLLNGITEKWVLVDWPENLRDGYDYEYAKERANAVVNAFYYESLKTGARILRTLGRDATRLEMKAARVKQAFAEQLLDAETGLFVDAPGSTHSSLHANAIPMAFGLVAERNIPAVVSLIKEKRLSCGVYIAPFVIEACYRAGEPELAYALITSKDKHSWHEMIKHGATTCMEAWGPDQKWNTSWCHPWSSGPVFLIAECIMGLTPAEPGWTALYFAPKLPKELTRVDFSMTVPTGRITVHYSEAKGFTLTVPAGVRVENEICEGVKLVEAKTNTHSAVPLTPNQQDYLGALGWSSRVGDGLGVWVSVDEQMFRIVEGGRIIWQAPCATAAKGTGCQMDSFQTPTGWHAVSGKTGEEAPWGQVFRGGKATGEVWQPGMETAEDLVLTRILFLSGLEEGFNKGGTVDSGARCIYVHGTNDEQRIGTPSSHGCIRLRNDDVMMAYSLIPQGAPLIISDATALRSE